MKLIPLLLSILCFSASADTIVAEYKGAPVMLAEVDEMLKSGSIYSNGSANRNRKFAQLSPEMKRAAVVAVLQERALVEKQAAAKFTASNEYKEHVAAVKRMAENSVFIEYELKGINLNDAVKKSYGELVQTVKSNDVLTIRQVEFKDEKSAIDSRQDLLSGKTTFASLEKTQDQQPKDGWKVSRAMLPPAIADALYALKVGEISSPLAANKNKWVLVKLEARQKRKVPELKDVRDQLERSAIAVAQKNYIDSLVDQQSLTMKG